MWRLSPSSRLISRAQDPPAPSAPLQMAPSAPHSLPEHLSSPPPASVPTAEPCFRCSIGTPRSLPPPSRSPCRQPHPSLQRAFHLSTRLLFLRYPHCSSPQPSGAPYACLQDKVHAQSWPTLPTSLPASLLLTLYLNDSELGCFPDAKCTLSSLRLFHPG